MNQLSYTHRVVIIALLTLITLSVGFALDIYLNKGGQIFSSTGAILIIYAVFVWRKERNRLEQANLTFFREMTKIKEEADASHLIVDEAIESIENGLSTISPKIDVGPHDSEVLSGYLTASFATHRSLQSGLLRVHTEVKGATNHAYRMLSLQRTLDDVNQSFVKTETILATIGTAVWGFGTFIFEAANHFL